MGFNIALGQFNAQFIPRHIAMRRFLSHRKMEEELNQFGNPNRVKHGTSSLPNTAFQTFTPDGGYDLTGCGHC